MTAVAKPKVAIVYTHFPHYRAAVFAALSGSHAYHFDLYYDSRGVSETIMTGPRGAHHHNLQLRRFRKMMWQAGALGLAWRREHAAVIFLGNPFILSTWIATVLARLRGKPVLFWTHGWLSREAWPKRALRNSFYRLADALLLYGQRAKDLGIAQGFAPARLHVIGNSLDYDMQRKMRAAILSCPDTDPRRAPLERPFFLSVARLIGTVRLDMAIAAMAHLPHGTALVLVGDGPERPALQAQAQRLGVDVRFMGAIYDEDQLAQLFMATRAVVSPGKVGLLAMHALAYGAPVITHDDLDRQMPEVEAIEAGQTGAFFRFGDVADLAQQMAGFLDQSAAQRAASRARAIATIEQGYTPEMQVRAITSALDTSLQRAT